MDAESPEDQEPFPIERRIRAAMVLAGVDFSELARRIGRQGMAARTLRGMATPEEKPVPQPHHLRYIAEACGISPSFFTIDLAMLDGETRAEIKDLRSRLEAVEDQLRKTRLEDFAADLAALRRSLEGLRGTEDLP